MEKIALEAARLLVSQEGAGWSVAVLLGLACLHLHREGARAQAARLAEAGATATALERASQTNAAVAAALESRTRVLEDLARLTAEIARGMTETARSMSEIARSVERGDARGREKLDSILRRLGDPHSDP